MVASQSYLIYMCLSSSTVTSFSKNTVKYKIKHINKPYTKIPEDCYLQNKDRSVE